MIAGPRTFIVEHHSTRNHQMHSIMNRPRAGTRRVALAALSLVLGACGSGEKKADSTASASPAVPAATAPAADSMGGMAGNNMSGMAGMTGDADHDFLRMMSDHHKGLIAIAHMTKERKDAGGAVADAVKLDKAQDAELDHMMTMLEKDFKDPYAPKVIADHQAMALDLKAKNGKDYERAFYQGIIKHHQEALVMIDGYLPKAKNAMLKQMAEKMKADQAKEIGDFQKKLSALGA